MTYSVVIVGLGRIGMGYDLDLDRGQFALSHARAFTEHDGFELVGGVDPDPAKRLAFEASYKRSAYPSVDTALPELSPDVVVIAVPTNAHAPLLQDILEHTAPRAILCEKPIAYDVMEARTMLKACDERDVKLFVNYMRRSEPGAIEVKSRIETDRIAAPLKGLAWYSKGFLHNGSHFFNLLTFWLGPWIDAELISAGRHWDANDPEPDVLVRFTRGTVVFMAAREEEFSYYAIELLGTNGRLRYDRGGETIEWTRRADEVLDSGCRELVRTPELLDNDMDRYQWHVADQLREGLSGADAEICTGGEALITLECMQNIIDMRNRS